MYYPGNMRRDIRNGYSHERFKLADPVTKPMSAVCCEPDYKLILCFDVSALAPRVYGSLFLKGNERGDTAEQLLTRAVRSV